MAKKLTLKNERKVFDAILAMDKEERKIIYEAFNEALDSLRDEDFFGTEGQCDPRGDGRG